LNFDLSLRAQSRVEVKGEIQYPAEQVLAINCFIGATSTYKTNFYKKYWQGKVSLVRPIILL
jgi:hypothetical protein